MVYLTFVSEFNLAHRLWKDELSEKENNELFAECSNLHGHLYRVEVTLAGDVSPSNPMVIGRGALRGLVDDVLSSRFRHGDLNAAFEESGFMPTGENVTRSVWKLVEPALPEGITLTCVRVVETPKNSFLYRGEGALRRLSAPMF